MLRSFRSLAPIAALIALLSSATHASAQPEAAQRFLAGRHETAAQLLGRPASDARNRQLTQVLESLLDYDELARRALGTNWSQRTPAERTQFTQLLRQLVERSYQGNLERTLRYDVRYTAAEPEGDAVVVRTVARSRANRRAPEVSIDYSMRLVGATWRVFDVQTDGVSLVVNYRNQFNRIIQREGWDGLIQRMQARIAGGNTDV